MLVAVIVDVETQALFLSILPIDASLCIALMIDRISVLLRNLLLIILIGRSSISLIHR